MMYGFVKVNGKALQVLEMGGFGYRSKTRKAP